MVTAFGREDIRAQAEQIGIERYLAEAGERIGALRHADGAVRCTRRLTDGDGRTTKGESQSTTPRGVRVLLVEDNEMNQQVATELLESAGAVVTVANHGGRR